MVGAIDSIDIGKLYKSCTSEMLAGWFPPPCAFMTSSDAVFIFRDFPKTVLIGFLKKTGEMWARGLRGVWGFILNDNL